MEIIFTYCITLKFIYLTVHLRMIRYFIEVFLFVCFDLLNHCLFYPLFAALESYGPDY